MLRLIADLFRVVHRILWGFAAFFGSRAVMILIGVLAVLLFIAGAGTGDPVWAIVAPPLLFVNYALRTLAANIRPGAWPERQRARRVKAEPVPIVAVIAQPADRPTAKMAMARLDPVLRRIIETPPPAAIEV